MPLPLQTRLLRILQEREVVRLGGARPVPVDVRVIAATHRVLADLVEQGKLRSDLYYRLNILRLHLPPLRERPEDIPPLALQLLHTSLRRFGSSLPADQVLAPFMPVLRSYGWPGNVRELENITERMAVILCEYACSSMIDYATISDEFPELVPRRGTIAHNDSERADQPTTLDDAAVLGAITRAGGNRQAAAQLLGVSRTTLWRRIRLLNERDTRDACAASCPASSDISPHDSKTGCPDVTPQMP
jgi:propionate catabolism operon transcriptional regulator